VGFAGLQIHHSRRRSCGNVGIPAGISKGCGKGGKPASWLSMLSVPRHFHGYGFGEIALCSLQVRAIRALPQKRLESELRRNSRYYTRNLVLLPRWEEACRVKDEGQLRGNMDKCSDKRIEHAGRGQADANGIDD